MTRIDTRESNNGCMYGIRALINLAFRSALSRVELWFRDQARALRNALPHPSAPPGPDIPAHRSVNVYRPQRHTSRRRRTRNVSNPKRIVFKPENGIAFNTSVPAIDDLVDALTGAPLHRAPGLRQCQRCKAHYHRQSYEFIMNENNGRCVACLSPKIPLLTADSPTRAAPVPAAAAVTPVLVNPANYHAHSDRLVELEGDVVDVLQSRGGQQFALMFEQATWSKGIKLVIPARLAFQIGGPGILFKLRAKTVRVRGLLKMHPLLGPQIMASGPEAIVWVR